MDKFTRNNNPASIAVVVVIYGSKLTNCNVYNTLIKNNIDNISCLLVFDNSQTKQYEKIDLPNGKYEYVWDPSNPGLSIHYNEAARYARQHGYEWILLSDQDTTFPPEAMAEYEKALTENLDCSLFVPIHKISGDRFLSPVRSCIWKQTTCIKPGMHKIKEYDIINSGMLIKVADFIKAGGYKEDVSLDFSDFQFIERLKRVTKNFIVLNIECIQDFSNNAEDKAKLISRFKKYCQNAANFETRSIYTKARISYLVLKHTIALSVRCKTTETFKILVKSIIKK